MRSPLVLCLAVTCGLASASRAQVSAEKPLPVRTGTQTQVRGEVAPQPFFFRANDRIVFLGDSITAQYQYSSYMELYLTTRFPQWNLMFLNAGIGGDTANGGANRFSSHVLAEKPTAVTINFGMNDAGYGAFNPGANANYVRKTADMLEAAQKAGVRIGLVSPNAVDRRVNPNFKLYVETQKQFYAPLAELAAKYKFAFADQYATTRAAVEEMEKTDPKAVKVKPYYDGFHTSPSGGLLMAHSILKGLHAPALVSSAKIVVGPKVVSMAENCTISTAVKTETGVSFERLDGALPMPVQADWASVMPYMSELKDLNDYSLTVEGLAEGDYNVSIDGKVVATYPAKSLAAGVNLGNVTTGPIYEQAAKVATAIAEKNKLVSDRFFNVLMYNPPAWLGLGKGIEEPRAVELAKRLKAIEEKQAAIHKLAMPVPHAFKVEKK